MELSPFKMHEMQERPLLCIPCISCGPPFMMSARRITAALTCLSSVTILAESGLDGYKQDQLAEYPYRDQGVRYAPDFEVAPGDHPGAGCLVPSCGGGGRGETVDEHHRPSRVGGGTCKKS